VYDFEKKPRFEADCDLQTVQDASTLNIPKDNEPITDFCERIRRKRPKTGMWRLWTGISLWL